VRNETGFTLIELLVVIAATGILFSGLGTAIYQMITVTEYGGDELTALHELQNAAYWLNTDGQMAVSATDGGSLILTLPTAETITYSLSGTSLQRTDGQTTVILAQNVSNVSFTAVGRLVTMNITSAPPGRTAASEQGTYQVYLRPVAE
jgi:prepilin-type N-terminal cleavage/methylation domain-containing protein